RDLRIRAGDSAADRIGERLRSVAVDIGHDHGLVPAAHEGARHVSCADYADLHRSDVNRRSLRLVEEALLDQPRALLRRYLDVARSEKEDLVGDALHAAVERVG